MYITVSRWFSKTGSIIDAAYSYNQDKEQAQAEAIKSKNWTFESGEYITTELEWVENQQMIQK